MDHEQTGIQRVNRIVDLLHQTYGMEDSGNRRGNYWVMKGDLDRLYTAAMRKPSLRHLFRLLSWKGLSGAVVGRDATRIAITTKDSIEFRWRLYGDEELTRAVGGITGVVARARHLHGYGAGQPVPPSERPFRLDRPALRRIGGKRRLGEDAAWRITAELADAGLALFHVSPEKDRGSEWFGVCSEDDVGCWRQVTLPMLGEAEQWLSAFDPITGTSEPEQGE